MHRLLLEFTEGMTVMNGKFRKMALSFLATMLLAPLQLAPVKAAAVCENDSDIGHQLNLPVYRWHDDARPTNGYIVAVHGLTFYASAFDNLGKDMASKGFQFYAADMRGFGRWKTENVKYGGDDQIHFSQSEEDIKNVCQALRQKHPGEKVYILGESLGANLAFWLASNHPELCDGVIVSAPCFETDMHPSPRWAVDFVKGISHPNKPMDLTPYITPYLSNDRKLTDACLKDTKICRRLSPVELFKAGRTNKEALVNLKSIPEQMPVLVLAGKVDKVMHTSAIPKALPKIGSKQISVHILADRGHLLLEHQTVDGKITGIIDHWLAGPEMTASVPAAEKPQAEKLEVENLEAQKADSDKLEADKIQADKPQEVSTLF